VSGKSAKRERELERKLEDKLGRLDKIIEELRTHHDVEAPDEWVDYHRFLHRLKKATFETFALLSMVLAGGHIIKYEATTLFQSDAGKQEEPVKEVPAAVTEPAHIEPPDQATQNLLSALEERKRILAAVTQRNTPAAMWEMIREYENITFRPGPAGTLRIEAKKDEDRKGQSAS